MKLKTNDKVIVISGKDKGKKGKIIRTIVKDDRVVVEGVNIIKKHQRPSQKFQGGIIDRPAPLPVSKVMLICPACGKPARIGRRLEEEKRRRYCRKCKEMIDRK